MTTHGNLNKSWSLQFNPGGWNVVSATGYAYAFAYGVGVAHSGNWQCWDENPPDPPKWEDFDVDRDPIDGTADLLAGSVSANASTTSSPWLGVSSSASIGGNAFAISSSSHDSFGDENGKEQMSCVGEGWCRTLRGRYGVFEFAAAGGVMARSYVLVRQGTADMSYTKTMSYHFIYTKEVDALCSGGLTTAGPIVLLRVDFVSHVNTAVHNDGSSSESVSQGLIGIMSNGQTIRMGFFDDPDFDSQATGTGFEIDGSVMVETVLSDPSIVGVTNTVVEDSFHEFDGNVDGDPAGFVCWDDRILMIELQGVSFGQASYTPRADADLNGLIDANDVDELNEIGCSVDVNCDGVVDTVDLTQYLILYNAADPSADMNADGVVDVLDYFLFLEVFKLGC